MPDGQNTCAPVLRDFYPRHDREGSGGTQNRLRINSDLAKQFNRFAPFSPLPPKISLYENQNSCIFLPIPPLRRGTLRAIVTKREAGCDGREGLRDDRRPARTAKACGPVPPTLGSTPGQKPGGRRLESPVLRGERAISRKTIAQGRPGRLGRTCMLVCVLPFCTRDRGCGQHPAFPAPSSLMRVCDPPSLPELRRDKLQNSGRPCRGNADTRLLVIANERERRSSPAVGGPTRVRHSRGRP